MQRIPSYRKQQASGSLVTSLVQYPFQEGLGHSKATRESEGSQIGERVTCLQLSIACIAEVLAKLGRQVSDSDAFVSGSSTIGGK